MGDLGDIFTAGSELLKAALPAVNQYLGQQMQIKQAKKVAKIMQAGQSGFPQLGTGNMAFVGAGGMMTPGVMQPYGFGSPVMLPQQQSTTGNSILDQTLGGLGFTSYAQSPGACPGLFVAPSGPMKPRPLSLVMAPNPVTGRMSFWRHVGSPILFSGDIAHCKRVSKILGRSSRRFGRKR